MCALESNDWFPIIFKSRRPISPAPLSKKCRVLFHTPGQVCDLSPHPPDPGMQAVSVPPGLLTRSRLAITVNTCYPPPPSTPLETPRQQLGSNKFLLTDGMFLAKALNRTLVEYPVKDSRWADSLVGWIVMGFIHIAKPASG